MCKQVDGWPWGREREQWPPKSSGTSGPVRLFGNNFSESEVENEMLFFFAVGQTALKLMEYSPGGSPFIS